MPQSTEPLVLALPARVDAAAAASLYAQWQPRAAALEAIDFAAVESIDSAGVALVQQLAADAAAQRGQAPALRAPTPGYLQICRAHRLAVEGGA